MDIGTLIIMIASTAAFASVLAVGLPLLRQDHLASRLKAVAAKRQELSARQRAGLRSARKGPAKRGTGLMRSAWPDWSSDSA